MNDFKELFKEFLIIICTISHCLMCAASNLSLTTCTSCTGALCGELADIGQCRGCSDALPDFTVFTCVSQALPCLTSFSDCSFCGLSNFYLIWPKLSLLPFLGTL